MDGSRSGAAGRRRTKFSSPEIDTALARRVRDVVRGMQQDANPAYTLRQFVEEALRAHCEVLEHRYHHGEGWPHVDQPLEPGRPGGG